MIANPIIPFPDEVRLISENPRFDPVEKEFYWETKWECRGHEIDVNIDEYGYHARVDGGTCAPNLCQEQLIAFVCLFLEKTK